MKHKQLQVHWSLEVGMLVPRSVHVWESPIENINYSVNISDEVILPFVMSIVTEALQRRLPRDIAWDLSEISVEMRPFFERAAAIYLRGVRVMKGGSTGELLSQVMTRGIYPVLFYEKASEIVRSLHQETFILVDAKVSHLWHIPGDATVVSSEDLKSVSTVNRVATLFRASGKSNLAIIGGGLLCDVGAFVAWLTQTPFVLIPTTLLAMIDASVGGKSGVNAFPYGKNLIGAFSFPSKVMMSTEWLTTLSEEEWFSGATEGFKHVLLSGDVLWRKKIVEDLRQHQLNHFLEDLPRMIQIKADIVARDTTEHGDRAFLNFGHTTGHALEALVFERFPSGPFISHGASVAVGMWVAIEISRVLNILTSQEAERLIDDIRNIHILPDGPVLQNLRHRDVYLRLVDLMGSDKKMSAKHGAGIMMILPTDENSKMSFKKQLVSQQVILKSLETVFNAIG